MTIAVVALGKIGLPLAVQFAGRGHPVIGADIDQLVVDQVNRSVEPFPGEEGLAARLAAAVSAGRLTATTDTACAVAAARHVVVVVPLLLTADKEPDFGPLDSATRDIGRGLRPGTLVSFETTLPVGTTRGRWKPLLEATSGLIEGRDFHVVFSPERVLTGRVFADLRRYPKLVGALSEAGAARAVSFYQDVLEFDERADLARGNGVWDLGSAEAAEMAKLAETTYRDVNIGLANQFAKFAGANGIDVHRVIEASNSQPYSHIHQPGIAVGGHCIPVYPELLLWSDPDATIVRAARDANAGMPAHCVRLARDAYGDLAGARVVVLGASYRGKVKETAYSGVYPTVAALAAEGALVTVHDPMYTNAEIGRLGFRPHRLGAAVDVAVLHTDHPAYATVTEVDLPGVQVVIDGRRHLDPAGFATCRLIVVGTPPPASAQARGVT